MSDNDKIIIGDYIYLSTSFEQGKNYKLYKGYHIRTKLNVIIKEILFKNNKNIINKLLFYKKFQNEMKRFLHFSNNNLVIYHDYIISKDTNTLYLISEDCYDGNLRNLLEEGPLHEKVARFYFIQIINGIKYLLEKKILHRNINPSNILLTNNKNEIKLYDFIISTIFNYSTNDYTYTAPEILNNTDYTNKSDIWTLGIILYEMLFNQLPYKAHGKITYLNKISTEKLLFPITINNISGTCIDLIRKMLKKNVKKRLTWNELFNHPWLSGDSLEESEQIFQNLVDSTQSLDSIDTFNLQDQEEEDKQEFYDELEGLIKKEKDEFEIIDELDLLVLPTIKNEIEHKMSLFSYVKSFVI